MVTGVTLYCVFVASYFVAHSEIFRDKKCMMHKLDCMLSFSYSYHASYACFSLLMQCFSLQVIKSQRFDSIATGWQVMPLASAFPCRLPKGHATVNQRGGLCTWNCTPVGNWWAKSFACLIFLVSFNCPFFKHVFFCLFVGESIDCIGKHRHKELLRMEATDTYCRATEPITYNNCLIRYCL